MSGAEPAPNQQKSVTSFESAQLSLGMADGDEWIQPAVTIQPHGLLLGLSTPAFRIVQVSANTSGYLGIAPQLLLDRPLASLMAPDQVEILRQSLQHTACVKPLRLSLQTATGNRVFEGTVHRQAAGVILELEPASPSQPTEPWMVTTQLARAIAKLQSITNLDEFFQVTATEIRRMTGFDRVMVYQFDPQGAGAVIAEAKRADFAAYLGLHYPATDIPTSVLQHYASGMARFIPNLNAAEIDVLSSETAAPIDLQNAILRGTHPCCVAYHQNMGVAAMLVVAIHQEQSLWGLISCHHAAPKWLPVEVRTTCELLGQFVSAQLASKINNEELDYLVKLRSRLSTFVHSIAQIDDLKQALINPGPRLLDLVSATGAAICLEDEITLLGSTPTGEQVHGLIQWAETQSLQNSLFHTVSLSKHYPAAIADLASASGLLLLQISQVRRYYILWFRPEVLQTVNWAGNPHDAIAATPDSSPRSPRQSFAQWQETVRGTALPWKACELEIALDLRSAIVGIVLRKADELARMNQELERSNRELDSFAYAASHDLKEPLRGIHNFATLLLKGYADRLDEVGTARLQTLVRLTRRMEALIDALLKFSRLGQAELHLKPTDLNLLIEQAIAELRMSHPDQNPEICIPRALPIAQCDAVLLSDVFTNLLSNAFKYNDKPKPWIEIGWFLASDPSTSATAPLAAAPAIQAATLICYVRDNGIGIRERHLQLVFRLFKRLHEQQLYGGGTGAGLTIAQKIIERHGGRLWVESAYGEGATFYFTLNLPSP